MKKQSISENLRQKKKLELWALIFVYFIVSLTSAFGDSVELIISQVNDSCYIFEVRFLKKKKEYYTLINIYFLKISKHLGHKLLVYLVNVL